MKPRVQGPGANEGEPRHPTQHPGSSQSSPRTGMEPSGSKTKTYDSNIPLFPVLGEEGGILQLANDLGAASMDPGSTSGVSGPPATISAHSPPGVPSQNREDWDVEAITPNKVNAYQHPSRPLEVGRTGILSGMESASGAWQATLKEIAQVRGRHADEYRQAGKEPLWLDEAVDHDLQARVAERIRQSDIAGAMVAIDAWKKAWLRLLGREPRERWIELDSDVLGEHVVVALKPAAAQEAQAARPRLVVYDSVEVEHLHGTQDAELIRAVQHAKIILGGQVQDPRLSDHILAEHAGRVRRRNQGVHDVFAEARRRLGTRASRRSA